MELQILSNSSKHNLFGGNYDFDEVLSNAVSVENGRFDEILSNWRSLCKLHYGLSGADDFDTFKSNSSKHNLLGRNTILTNV